jgi:hypothetical protein
LLQEIEQRYHEKWFKQVKFLQTTNFYRADTIYKTERWAEEYVFPGQLIIKFNGDNQTSDGFLYRQDSVYIFKESKIKHTEEVTHDLLILSMDIYNMSSDESFKRISELDYDLTKFDIRTYNGKQVYVIGAEKGDTISNQIWFDAKDLYFVKMIKKTEYGIQEVCFNDYININGSAWIEQEVVFRIDGQVYMVEKYFDIEIPDEKKTEIKVSDFNEFSLALINPLNYLLEYKILDGSNILLLIF